MSLVETMILNKLNLKYELVYSVDIMIIGKTLKDIKEYGWTRKIGENTGLITDFYEFKVRGNDKKM